MTETYTCNKCQKAFCFEHLEDHRKQLAEKMKLIQQEYNVLKGHINPQNMNKTLLEKIDKSEKEFIKTIRDIMAYLRARSTELTEETNRRLSNLMDILSDELHFGQEDNRFAEEDLDRWTIQMKDIQENLEKQFEYTLAWEISSALNDIKAKIPVETRVEPDPIQIPTAYPCISFAVTQATDGQIDSLFKDLMILKPMERNRPVSDTCEIQTNQMENFLLQTFGFRSVPREFIVHRVRAFHLNEYPHQMRPQRIIHFPNMSSNSFPMTISEIISWQYSYKVYANKIDSEMTKEFLHKALQGKSTDGKEAFWMKFVVRISTCPILMESDGKVIHRRLSEDWSNRIKLISASGIDFAGRKHDIGDIQYYITNWQEVFQLDLRTNSLMVSNGRDFIPVKNGPAAILNEGRLRDSLVRMVRLRLRACDKEGVQIVVETGIGLDVFSGKQIGIDQKVRQFSAQAIRKVLEEDGQKYRNIRAVVLALPTSDQNISSTDVSDTFHDFENEFRNSNYNGPIPVLIADQDMHRLTIAIARQGFTVSELNPADSNGVFGGYWQNRWPAVEEKLALTTVGLLVQHHLINPEVLKRENYYFLDFNE
ncbi:hypothetical protein I4U23_020456 [Adineta vaga]|nr:hypothetical protein I4U23_020456 [Adineta vaga]